MPSYRLRPFLGLVLVLCALMVACGSGKPQTFQPLNITSGGLPAGTVGIAYGVTFTATGGRIPYTWSITAGSLPTGLTLNASTGAISGTPTNAAVYNFTVQCTDTQTPTAAIATKNTSITIRALNPLSITTSSLTAATINSPYLANLAATGGVTPYTWAIDSGSLPAGLTLSATGLISGTPTTLGSSSFTVKVTDSNPTPSTATKALTLAVNNPTSLTITTTSLPNAFINNLYAATIHASGGVAPYVWTLINGTVLPPGLRMSASGVISGVATTLGTTQFTVQVTDAEPTPQTATATLTITVQNIDPLVITTTSVPDATINVAYSATLAATGGVTPYTWTVDSGTLPTGLSLSRAGVISGTPTALGTFSFTVKVVDFEQAQQSATVALTINVKNPGPLTITTTSLPNAIINTSYNQTLAATGGVPPYTWSITAGTLPTGLSLSTGGIISGTPTVVGTSTFTVQVADSEATQQTASASLTLTVTSLGNGALNGSYAFSYNGFSNGSPIFMAGSIAADGNGNVTGGTIDLVSSAAPVNQSLTGTYNIDGTTGLGTMTLTAGTIGTLNLKIAAPSGGGVIRFIQTNDKGDATGTYGSGVFRKQDTTVFDIGKLGGVYVFGLYGVDSAGHRLGRIGAQTIGTNGSISNGNSDVNDAGTTSTVTTASGTYLQVDPATGRGLVTFDDSTGTTKYVFYIVSVSELILLENETTLPANQVIGTVLKQTLNNTGGIDLAGNAIFELSGIASGTVPDIQIGRAFFQASNSFTAASDENSGGTLSSPSYSGSFAELNAHVTFSGATPLPVTMYLYRTNSAFVLGTDASVKFGYLETQNVPVSNVGGITGTYLGGSLNPVLTTVTDETDLITSDGNGNLTAYTSNSSGPGGNNMQTTTGTYAVDNTGRAVITINSQQAAVGYSISVKKFVIMPAGALDTTPKLMSLEH